MLGIVKVSALPIFGQCLAACKRMNPGGRTKYLLQHKNIRKLEHTIYAFIRVRTPRFQSLRWFSIG